MFYYVAATLATFLVLSTTSTASAPSDWNNPLSSQYHIQTDEGNERYFRYQTISGQYRKEKRLEDGTVVGTYAWIDDDGFLRQRDYIADNAGYRILKTKNVYVGRDTPIAKAIKQAKKVPPSAGTLVKTNVVDKAVLPPPTQSTLGTPYVEISHNSIPSSTATPFVEYSTTPSPISTTIEPPVVSTERPTSLYLPASTLALEPAQISTENPFALNPWYYSAGQGGEQIRGSNSDNKNYPYTFQNGPTYPIDTRGQTYTGSNNNIGNGYDPQYDYYDGVSVTNDGFRYYIPRAYHEEQNLPGDKKSGSFGYIDPFGIRRVIYYNAAPGTGFQHRKNNRYVGFNATPYDPRPY